MIVIDMDMPECWDDCRFNNGCECCLIDAVCTDETAEENGELPSFCPIKCDIEDIKQEINEAYQQSVTSNLYYAEGLEKAFETIDKYISGDMRGDTDADCD